MNKQQIILVSFFLIKVNDAKNCSKIDKVVKHCPVGRGYFFHQNIIHNCVAINMQSASWESAKNACSDNNGGIATAIPYKEKQQLDAYIRFVSRMQQVWIGLTDRVSEGHFVYTNGYQMTAGRSIWNPGEPSNSRRENCAFISNKRDGKLADASCGDRRSSLCQEESLIGPRELKVEVNWHDGVNKVFYNGYNASVACSVFSPLNGKIVWSAENGNKRVDIKKFQNDVTIKSYLEENEQGKCRQKTYSIFSFTANDASQGLHFVCYPRPPVAKEICPKNSNRFTYCQHAEKVQVSRAVRGSPTISLSHPGMPGPAIFNTTITMKCAVPTDGTQQSIFLINYAQGPVKPKSSYLHRRRIAATDGILDILTFNLPFEQNYADVTFSCFVNDVVAGQLDTKCHSHNPFCTELTVISTSTKGAKKGPRSTQILGLQSNVTVKPNYFYDGTALNASCSALDAYQGALRWKAFDRSKTEVDLTGNVLSSNSFHSVVNGENKTEGELSISVSPRINGVRFSCYSDNFLHTTPCEYERANFKFCDAADMTITVVSKPDHPNLTIAYQGYPKLPARPGSTLTANCTISSRSAVFLLHWVIYNFGLNGTVIVDRDASIVEAYKKSSNKQGKVITHYLKSTLKIPLNKSKDGMSIACLAYDINIDKVNDVCTMTDDLCNKSEPVEVKKRPKLIVTVKKELVKSLKFIAISIGILMVILCLLILGRILWRKKTSGAEDTRSVNDAAIMDNNIPPDNYHYDSKSPDKPQSIVGAGSEVGSRVDSETKSNRKSDTMSMTVSTIKKPESVIRSMRSGSSSTDQSGASGGTRSTAAASKR